MPHPLINKKFIWQLALYLRMLAPLHSAIDKGEYEKYLLLPPYRNSLITACSQDQLVTVKGEKGYYASFSELSNILQNVSSKRIAS